MRAASVVAAITGLVSLQGCALVLQGAPTEAAFRRGLAAAPYVADAARRDAIMAGAKQMRVCSRRTEVRRLMGEPDFAVRTHDSNGNHTAAQWTYLISEVPTAMKAVHVSLNKAGDVFSILPVGLPDIPFSTVD